MQTNLKSGQHNCLLTDWRNETHLYICSRCLKCYVCEHLAVYMQQTDTWVWKCKIGSKVKFNPCINDGKVLKEREFVKVSSRPTLDHVAKG